MRKLSIKQLITMGLLSLTINSAVSGAVLKLSDAPLSQLVELYAKESGYNVFLDESVQSQRKITAHLNGLKLDDAFKVVLKTINLETCTIGENTVIVFPLEKASRYRSSKAPIMLPVPGGITGEWLGNFLRSAMPGLKITALPGKDGQLIILGPEDQVEDARKITANLPDAELAGKTIEMSAAEAALAVKELALPGMTITANGLAVSLSDTSTFKKIEEWKNETAWGDEIVYPENLDFKQISQIVISLKTRAT